jgi:hypothetical protein
MSKDKNKNICTVKSFMLYIELMKNIMYDISLYLN